MQIELNDDQLDLLLTGLQDAVRAYLGTLDAIKLNGAYQAVKELHDDVLRVDKHIREQADLQ